MVARIQALAGIVFQWNGTTVGGVEDAGEPDNSWEKLEMQLHDSPGGASEKVLTNKKTGTIKLSGAMLLADPGQIKLRADYVSKTGRAWTRTAPDNSWQQSGNGLITKCGPSGKSPKDASKIDVEIEIDGDVSWLESDSSGLTALEGIEENGPGDALTFIPAFDVDAREYNVTVDTASTYIKLTPTAAAHTITVAGAAVTSGNQSGEIALGDADSVTDVTILAQETGKVAQVTVLHVARPAGGA